MNAICTKCERVTSWRAQRGSRLRDHRCTCGGILRAKRDDPKAIAASAGSEPPNCCWLGSKEGCLVVCNRRATHNSPQHGNLCEPHAACAAELGSFVQEIEALNSVLNAPGSSKQPPVPQQKEEELPMCRCGYCGEDSRMTVDSELHPVDHCPHCNQDGFMELPPVPGKEGL